MIRTVPTRVVVAAAAALIVGPGLWGSAASATGPAKSARFCSSLKSVAPSLELLGGSTTKVTPKDAARTASSISRAISAAPRLVRSAGQTLALAYHQLAKGASAVVFASESTMNAATTFFAYYTENCRLRPGQGRRTDQTLNLSLSGAVTAALSTPDAVDQFTVASIKTKLDCSLVP